MVMANEPSVAPVEGLEGLIHPVRGHRVMLDSDLARIYGTTTARLNQALKRNPERFPSDFACQLTREEFAVLMSQIVTSKPRRGGRQKLPWVFTEHGALMLASVLNSPVAVAASVRVVRAFVAMREQLTAHRELAQQLHELEARVTGHDAEITELFEAIRRLIEPPLPEDRREIGFHMRETPPPYRVRPHR